MIDEIFYPIDNYNVLNFMFINPTTNSNFKVSIINENNVSMLLLS